jgi:hypothetical protein
MSLSRGGETILLDTNEGRYHSLNEVGTRVWELLRGNPRVGDVVDAVRAEYDMTPESTDDQVDTDVKTLIAELCSKGAIRVQRRALEVLDHDGESTLPPLYAAWITDVIDGPLPKEPHATCHDCAMAKPSGGAATANVMRFDPVGKCCTYSPMLPNYLVGRILSDSSASATIGVQSVRRRMANNAAATPLGLGLSNEYLSIYKHVGQLFGKSEALRCPHFIEDGGLCGIWKHRNSICTTWFCKFDRGAVGKAFWDALLELLHLVERQVAVWCMRELGLDASAVGLATLRASHSIPPWPGEESEVWGHWLGREEEFYIRAGRIVSDLSWDRIFDLGDVDLRVAARKVQMAYARHGEREVPTLLRLAAVGQLAIDRDTSAVSGYSQSDMLLLPAALIDALYHFDGRRPTVEVVQRIETELGQVLDRDMIGRLVDFRVLVPVPDLSATDLGKSVRTGDSVSERVAFR